MGAAKTSGKVLFEMSSSRNILLDGSQVFSGKNASYNGLASSKADLKA